MSLRNTLCIVAAMLYLAGMPEAVAQDSTKPPSVHLVWMGGDDCPPCVAWRRFELPKLENSSEFQSIKFSYVTKTLRSAVPPRFFLPTEVKPLKDKLDEANSGRIGSPQAAVVVNGEVFDYLTGPPHTAEEIEKMLFTIRKGEPYPYPRCLKVSKEWQSGGAKCEIKG